MTSREKVQKMFRREHFDGMIIDMGGMYSDGISAEAYGNLLQHLGMSTDVIKVFDVSQQLAAPDLELVNLLGGDFMLAYRMRLRYKISCRNWKEDVLPNGYKCLVPSELEPVIADDGSKNIYVDGVLTASMPAGGHYYDQVAHPLADACDIAGLEGFAPERFLQDEVDYIAQEIDNLYENTDKAIVFGFGGSIFEQGQADFDFDNFYTNLLIEPELMHEYFSRLTDAHIYNLKQVLERAGDRIDVIHFRDDLGTQINLQLSIDTYRELIKPYHKKMFGYVHENYPDIRCMLHSCGAIFDLIPELIDAGVDVLNPVQISARGMDPKRLKDTYGDKIIFWGGGADQQNFVINHTADEIRQHVENNILEFKDKGGYVFTQVHNFQYDIEPEKILAIYETAKKYK